MRNIFKQIYCENCEYYIPPINEVTWENSGKCYQSIKTHNNYTKNWGIEHNLCSVARCFDMKFCLKAKEKVQEDRK